MFLEVCTNNNAWIRKELKLKERWLLAADSWPVLALSGWLQLSGGRIREGQVPCHGKNGEI
jgi:hypothetical protein